MNKRKIISIILSIVLLFVSMSVGAAAFSTETLYFSEMKEAVLFDSAAAVKNSLTELKKYVDIEKFKAAVLEGISQCSETVDISSFNIPVSADEYVNDFIWYNIPEAFNVYEIGCLYYSVNSKIILLSFTYSEYADTKEEYAVCFEQFVQAADKMLSGIENNDSLTDVEKALLLHDRLCLWTEYDYVTSSRIKHTAYGAFGKRAAVCQGYAMAYMYLLQRVGIDNYYCSSNKLNHGWNIVFINNKPYHVDVTWDDRAWGNSGRGFIGRAEHKNFLRSTAGIKETGHTASDFDAAPVDTAYDNYFWQKSSTAFQIVDNEIYYIDNIAETLNRFSDKKEILSVSDYWFSAGGGVWDANFSCLSSAGGDLFYSLSDGVYKYTVSTNSVQKVYSPSLSGYKSVFGFAYEDGYLICDINNTPNDANNLSQKKQAYSDITPVLTGIEINTPFSKDMYYLGDSFDSSGLTVKLIYSDKSETVLYSGFSFEGFSSDTVGEKTIRVTYKGFSDNCTVSVLCAHSSVVPVPETPSTCSLTGYSEGIYCNDCKTYISGHTVIPVNKNAHKWDGGSITREGNCSESGIKTYICERNSSHIRTENLPLVPANHINIVAVAEVPATSDSIGYTAGVYCNDCEKYISGHKEIAKTESIFRENENVKLYGDNVLVVKGMSAAQFLSLASSGARLTDIDGNEISLESLCRTDLVLVISDTEMYRVIVPGDVDCDGFITSSDARLALRAAVGLENYSEASSVYAAANIMKSDKLSSADARAILRLSVGLDDIRDYI